MRENDVIVIGGGLAGLTAAAAAAKRGKKVMVLSLGAGTLTIGGGIVDVLGYLNDGTPVSNPAANLQQLGAEHPYAKIGTPAVEDALKFFKEMCEAEGYPYLGDVNTTQWIPTAAGTLKPTCLVPQTMDTTELVNAKKVIIAGFENLKDFYPHLIAKNLKTLPGFEDKEYDTVMINPQLPEGRDVTSLDVARWLDTEAGRAACIAQMRKAIQPGSVVIIPPVLGTQPSYQVADALKKAIGCTFVETAAVPPSMTGYRLRLAVVNYLRKLGVKIVEQATVVRSIVENGKCVAVVTGNVDRERTYYAKSFVLANGGFYGGGFIAEPGKVIEPIFDLHVDAPEDHEQWANFHLFSDKEQPFAKFGVNVDDKLRPLDAAGKVVLSNVHIVGRNLRGYDFCFEKSGNGVAVASGYQAAMSL